VIFGGRNNAHISLKRNKCLLRNHLISLSFQLATWQLL
jgi:hypothetical protein